MKPLTAAAVSQPPCEHSPEPWTADLDQTGCRNIKGSNDEDIAYTVGLANDDEDRANAALLSAAPELATALRGMVDAVCVRGTKENRQIAIDFATDAALGAIRKSEGRS